MKLLRNEVYLKFKKLHKSINVKLKNTKFFDDWASGQYNTFLNMGATMSYHFDNGILSSLEAKHKTEADYEIILEELTTLVRDWSIGPIYICQLYEVYQKYNLNFSEEEYEYITNWLFLLDALDDLLLKLSFDDAFLLYCFRKKEFNGKYLSERALLTRRITALIFSKEAPFINIMQKYCKALNLKSLVSEDDLYKFFFEKFSAYSDFTFWLISFSVKKSFKDIIEDWEADSRRTSMLMKKLILVIQSKKE